MRRIADPLALAEERDAKDDWRPVGWAFVFPQRRAATDSLLPTGQ
jgi:hypothetical protein